MPKPIRRFIPIGIKRSSTLTASARFAKLCTLVAILSSGPAIEIARADEYPSRPMTVIVTTAPGSSVDLAARFFGERIKAQTGQPWVIDNKPGSGGAIAAKAAASAKPDGYTLFLCTSGALSANPFLMKELSYDPVKDFVPVARMFRIDFALIINPVKNPATSLAELTALLRSRNGRVSFGHFSPSAHALAEQYRNLTGIEAAPAAYKSNSRMITELEAGDFDFTFSGAEFALTGNPKLRALAIAAERRSQLLPNLPTLVEAGLANALPLYSWFGLCLPTGSPDTAVKKLERLIVEIAGREETRTFMKTFAGEPFPGTGEELRMTQRQTTDDWKYFVTLAKIEAQ